LRLQIPTNQPPGVPSLDRSPHDTADDDDEREQGNGHDGSDTSTSPYDLLGNAGYSARVAQNAGYRAGARDSGALVARGRVEVLPVEPVPVDRFARWVAIGRVGWRGRSRSCLPVWCREFATVAVIEVKSAR